MPPPTSLRRTEIACGQHQNPREVAQQCLARVHVHTCGCIACWSVMHLFIGTEAKANVNLGDALRTSPLHLAATAGLVELVYMLLEAGAEIDARDSSGQASALTFLLSPGSSHCPLCVCAVLIVCVCVSRRPCVCVCVSMSVWRRLQRPNIIAQTLNLCTHLSMLYRHLLVHMLCKRLIITTNLRTPLFKDCTIIVIWARSGGWTLCKKLCATTPP